MSLAPGTKLGPYEILEPIGKGGMGEVYRGHDPRLRRDVAIKTSAERFSERFEREARAVAALNHPNICQIYDVGPNYLVMEYIEGPTLADRIKEGALPLDEALPIAEQIAAALEAAHEKAITHRDLKPANIKVKPDGVVKVLDFGLAKIGGPQPTKISEDSPTLSMAATLAGTILGTAAYMSPEQAKGKPVDKRADIWAFGVVLYEMVTGTRPFQGEEMVEILAAVVHGTPDLSPAPEKVRRLLAKCLEKDPKKRLRDMSGMEFLLTGEQPIAIAPPVPAKSSNLGWIAAGVIALIGAGGAWALWPQPKPLLPMTRLEVDLGENVAPSGSVGPDVAISPDGSTLAYVSANHIFALRLDRLDAKPVDVSGTGSGQPEFSPDGNWIAFNGAGLKKVAITGGTPLLLANTAGTRGLTWNLDGSLIAALNSVGGLNKVDGSAELKPVTTLLEGEVSQRWPQVLPGGQAVIFTSSKNTTSYDTASIELQSLKDGQRKTLARGGMFGRVVAASNGAMYLTYVNRGTLFAMPFDANALEVRGAATPVLDGVGYNSGDGSALLSFSHTGTLVYRSRSSTGSRIVQFMNAAGRTETILAKPDNYTYPRLSPDGTRLMIVGTEGGGTDVWVYDLKGSRSTRLTIGVGSNLTPTWTPDGKNVVYQGPGGMFWTRADGGSQPQQLTQSKNLQYPSSFAPDGKRMAFLEISPTTSYDLWTVPMETTSAGLKAGIPEKFLVTNAQDRHPAFSPDARWLAYASNETGQTEVYVRAFPDTGGRWTVSAGGGHYPIWSKNGRELFYRTEDGQVMVTNYSAKGDTFSSDQPHKFADKKLAVLQTNGTYDVAPDGRIVGLFPSEAAPGAERAQSHVTFLINFADEIARRVGSK